MKRLLITMASLVAFAVAILWAFGETTTASPDRPVYEAPPPPSIWSWTGCFIGTHVGGEWGHKTWSDPLLSVVESNNTNGWPDGSQIGCDYESDAAISGFEGEYTWARLKEERLHFTSISANTTP